MAVGRECLGFIIFFALLLPQPFIPLSHKIGLYKKP
jgi:hypothetical protein